MNEQRIDGAAQELKGGAKQAVAELTGDESLRAEGAVDRISGTASQAIGAARDAAAPVIDKARSLTRRKPWAVAALLGVVGMAVIGSLRGRGKAGPAAPARRGRSRAKS